MPYSKKAASPSATDGSSFSYALCGNQQEGATTDAVAPSCWFYAGVA